ncbi:MAG TPA: integrase arm-type DNA-binding domain-containing protein [Thermoanaerobaculia bacterium]|jgi:integrase|nr:integrase arm-type DNA-binding domain-containing protein [Thermoanaerobaculia bacterium]
MPRITKRFVDSISPTAKETEHWDDKLPGFGLRVKPSGVKSYVIRYRTLSGDQRRLTLGQHGKLTPEQARNLAEDRFAEIKAGGDPSAHRQEKRAAPTLHELAERYLKDYVEVHHKTGTARETRRLIERNLLPRLGTRKVQDISYEEIARLHGAMRGTPIEANRTLSALRGMMNKAEKWGWRPRGTNPCRDVDRNPERLRDRHLSFEELARLGAVLDAAEGNRSLTLVAAQAIRLLALSGARLGEVLTLEWSGVDLPSGCLRLKDSKVGPRTIYLGAPAVELIRALPLHSGNPYVFPGRREGGHFVGLQKCWERVRDEAKLEDASLHTLRHTFATVGSEMGFSPIFVAGLLGHRSWARVAGLSGFSTTEGYVHVGGNPLRQVAEAISRRIATALDNSEAEVLPFPSSKAS